MRFAYLATELRDLRRSLGDPLMDVLHRVLAATGLEVELSASPHALAARRRETLGTFLDIAAGFAAKQGGESLDGDATLLAFLGFLRTAVQYEKGLDSSLPGGDNTVKVLTAHKSKGLEWDVVAVPGLVTKQFPSEQARESWTSRPKVLPHALRGDAATLPDVGEWAARGLKSFKEAMKQHQETEELRLGYVTFTRPRSLLLGSGHWWGPQQKRPRGPSAFLEALRAHCEAGHGEIEHWAEAPEDGEENPALSESATEQAWPLPLDPTATARRRTAAATVRAHLERRTGQEPAAPAPPSLSVHDPDWPPPPPDEPWATDPYDAYDPYDSHDADEADPFEDAPPFEDAAPFGDAAPYGAPVTDPFDDAAAPHGVPVPGSSDDGTPSHDAPPHHTPPHGTPEDGPAPLRARIGAQRSTEPDLTAPTGPGTVHPGGTAHPGDAAPHALLPEERTHRRGLGPRSGRARRRAAPLPRHRPGRPAALRAQRHPAAPPRRRPPRLRPRTRPPHAAPAPARRPPRHALPRLGRIPLRRAHAAAARPRRAARRRTGRRSRRSSTSTTSKPSRRPSPVPPTPTAHPSGSKPPSSSPSPAG